MKPLVSIIIPTFNRAYLIIETLDSIVAQSYSNWECLIVDDGSTDETSTIINKYIEGDLRFRFMVRNPERPKGANACRNIGFENSNGTLINWCDSDDVMAKNHLELHVAAHNSENVDASVSNAKVFKTDTSIHVRDWSNINPKSDLITEMIFGQTMWQTNCVVWKRDCIGSLPFHEDLASSQEWTFHLTQIINGISYSIINESTCFVREHENRIGKIVRPSKSYSTFTSRRYILELLRQKQMLDVTREAGLYKFMLAALRQAVKFKYFSLVFKFIGYLNSSTSNSVYRKKIMKIVFVAFPIYLATGKGEKLFKLKPNG